VFCFICKDYIYDPSLEEIRIELEASIDGGGELWPLAKFLAKFLAKSLAKLRQSPEKPCEAPRSLTKPEATTKL
jgi:hypothetical protein